MLRGFNLSGAEYNPGSTLHGREYIFPVGRYAPGYETPEYVIARGYNCFRLPFRDRDHERLEKTVWYLLNLGATVIMDLRADDPSPWEDLAPMFAGNPRVMYGLLNEPHDISMNDWIAQAKAGIDAIRLEADNTILVPGRAHTGAHSWSRSGNAEGMLEIEGENLLFEAHQYADEDSSGTSSVCVDPHALVDRVSVFTDWLIRHDKRGFLAEFGMPNNPRCREAVTAMLRHVEHSGVYAGWTAWAMGPWWERRYVNLLEPNLSFERLREFAV